MIAQLLLAGLLVQSASAPLPPPGRQQGVAPSLLLLETFTMDPLQRSDLRFEGAALERLNWNDDAPAFPGDRPGSLTARYDALAEPGRFGLPLGQPLLLEDGFVASFVFEIASEHFFADPNGFFQISAGLWNSMTTGFERTGAPAEQPGGSGIPADTFDLLEWDYFPNVSPFFGGPFFSPVVLGSFDSDNPATATDGAFANAAFGFGPPVELPLDRPLALLVHNRPDDGEVAFYVYSWIGSRLKLIDGATTVISTAFMSRPEATFDTIGLTLWRDGFAVERSLQADVTFHAIGLLGIDVPSSRLRRLFPLIFGDSVPR